MKFKLDENTPFILKSIIESLGNHQVDSVFHEEKVGIDDHSLLALCLAEERILITLDTDFNNPFCIQRKVCLVSLSSDQLLKVKKW